MDWITELLHKPACSRTLLDGVVVVAALIVLYGGGSLAAASELGARLREKLGKRR